MKLPKSFRRGETFQGVKSGDGLSTVSVMTEKGTLESISDAYTAKYLRQNGLKYIEDEWIYLNDKLAWLLKLTNTNQDRYDSKNIYLLYRQLPNNELLLVRGHYRLKRLKSDPSIDDKIQDIILTSHLEYDSELLAEFDQQISIDIIEKGVSLVKHSESSYGLEGSENYSKSSKNSYRIFKSASSKLWIMKSGLSHQGIAKMRLENFISDNDYLIESQSVIKVDGRDAYEYVVRTANEDGTKKITYYVYLFTGFTIYQFIGESVDDFENNTSKYRQLTKSFKRR